MRAVVLRALGGPAQLTETEWADPVPDPGEVVVRLHAAALNRRDAWIRQGHYAKISLPIVLGSDGSGTVVRAGAGVPADVVGREVVANPCMNWTSPEVPAEGVEVLGMPRHGTYAELVKLPAISTHPKPAHLSFEQAAALPLAGLTAYRAVAVRARVRPSETVLVTGIGGGVATFALLFAQQLGARAYVTSGSVSKIEQAIALGAAGGVSYASEHWEREVVQLNGGLFDAVIDGAGGESFARALAVLKPGGRLVSYGATLGRATEVEVRRIFWKQLDVLGTTMGSPDDFAAMLALVGRGIHPVVDSTFDLSEAAAAHGRLESGDQFGKIVLRITPSPAHRA